MALAQLHRDIGCHQRCLPTACVAAEGKPTPFGGVWTVARNPFVRLKGLSARVPDDTVLVFPTCRDVHTFTMRYPLDIAFVDGKGGVVEVRRLVLPGVRLSNENACMVIERFARSGRWFVRGDSVLLSCGNVHHGMYAGKNAKRRASGKGGRQ